MSTVTHMTYPGHEEVWPRAVDRAVWRLRRPHYKVRVVDSLTQQFPLGRDKVQTLRDRPTVIWRRWPHF